MRLFTLSLVFACALLAQPPNQAGFYVSRSDPGACVPGAAPLLLRIDQSPIVLKYCSAANTWSQVGTSNSIGNTLVGTASQITVTGAGCTAGASGTCTVAIPASPFFTGTITGSALSLTGVLAVAGATTFSSTVAVPAGAVQGYSVGSQLTAAATLTFTNPVHHITSSAVTVTTISASFLPAGGGCVTLIPDAAMTGMTTSTGGNIALASTGVANKALTLCLDPNTNLFYPSY